MGEGTAYSALLWDEVRGIVVRFLSGARDPFPKVSTRPPI